MMSAIIDDQFSPSKSDTDSQKKTTRYYGVQFLRRQYPVTDDAVAPPSKNGIWSFCDMKEMFGAIYGPFLCAVLLTSIFSVVMGACLALAGHYVPRMSVATLMETTKMNVAQATNKEIRYNKNLDNLSIAGMVLLAVGGLVFSILVMLPLTCNCKKEPENDYALVATNDDDTILDVRATPTKKPGASILDQIRARNKSPTDDNPTLFSVFHHHIQPMSKDKEPPAGRPHSPSDKRHRPASPVKDWNPRPSYRPPVNAHAPAKRARSKSFSASSSNDFERVHRETGIDRMLKDIEQNRHRQERQEQTASFESAPFEKYSNTSSRQSSQMSNVFVSNFEKPRKQSTFKKSKDKSSEPENMSTVFSANFEKPRKSSTSKKPPEKALESMFSHEFEKEKRRSFRFKKSDKDKSSHR